MYMYIQSHFFFFFFLLQYHSYIIKNKKAAKFSESCSHYALLTHLSRPLNASDSDHTSKCENNV